MRRITVWADDHLASRVVKALEEIGADYMSEDYVMPKLPPRKTPPPRQEEPPATVRNMLKVEGPAFETPGKAVLHVLASSPKTLAQLKERLVGQPYGEYRYPLPETKIAAAIGGLVKGNLIKKVGKKYHAVEAQ